MINKEFEDVKEFHKAFDLPNKEKPTFLDKKSVKTRAGFMLEEIVEFSQSETVVDQADAMIDLIYFALGTLVEMGVEPVKLFDIVHKANMAKVWDDGKVHRRESDGKVIKPPEWKDPGEELTEEINKQLSIIRVKALSYDTLVKPWDIEVGVQYKAYMNYEDCVKWFYNELDSDIVQTELNSLNVILRRYGKLNLVYKGSATNYYARITKEYLERKTNPKVWDINIRAMRGETCAEPWELIVGADISFDGMQEEEGYYEFYTKWFYSNLYGHVVQTELKECRRILNEYGKLSLLPIGPYDIYYATILKEYLMSSIHE